VQSEHASIAHASADRLVRAFVASELSFAVADVQLAPADLEASLRSEAVRNCYLKQQVLVVRPDLYVAWSMSRTAGLLSDEDALQITQVLSGGSTDKDVSVSYYLTSLVTAFERGMRPVRKFFPMCFQVTNLTRQEAIEKMKKKIADFKGTTKVANAKVITKDQVNGNELAA